MIVVRDVFQLKFGAAREAVALWQEGLDFMRQSDAVRDVRLLTDLTGDYYTLVLESTYDSLADYDATMRSSMGEASWKSWYARFSPLVDHGRRELFTVVGSVVPPAGAGQARAQSTVGRR
jgi:hypothetical protein